MLKNKLQTLITVFLSLSILAGVIDAQTTDKKFQNTNSKLPGIIFKPLKAEQSGNSYFPEPGEDNTGRIWDVPFASTGNTISLSVQNNSGIEAENVSARFINLPTWLQFKSNSVFIKAIKANAASEAEFTFSVDKQAPVGKDTTLIAVINTSNGKSWTKAIRITIEAPKEYKLYNNYPNPFNPSTKIAFELPQTSRVELTIYDITGREIACIANEGFSAGFHEVTWDGINSNGERVSSGIYFYRISAGKWSKVMKMMMVK